MSKSPPNRYNARSNWIIPSQPSQRFLDDQDRAWRQHTIEYERELKPNLWVSFNTVKPVGQQKLMRMVKTYWRKVCQKYKVTAEVDTLCDVCPKSYDQNKYHAHCIVRVDGNLPEHHLLKSVWVTMLNREVFNTSDDGKIKIDDLASVNYTINVQPYAKKDNDHIYNHCRRYAATKHRWADRYSVDSNDKRSRRRRRKARLYDGPIPKKPRLTKKPKVEKETRIYIRRRG